MRASNRSGFTLLELLIVVIILGVLASLAIPQFAAAVDRSREAEALNAISAILTGEMVTFQEAGAFVAALPDSVTIPGVFHDWAAPTYAAGNGSGGALDGIAAGGALADGVTVTMLGTAHGHGNATLGNALHHSVRGTIVSTGAKLLQRARPSQAAYTNI